MKPIVGLRYLIFIISGFGYQRKKKKKQQQKQKHSKNFRFPFPENFRTQRTSQLIS
jgi:hypothetical protein